MEKVILTTGGTGGHIFPALAVSEELRKRNPDIQILFIGSFYGPEARLAQQAGIKFKGLHVRGFLGRGMRAVPAFFDMGLAVAKAIATVAAFKPDVVAGFGGYASFAPVMAAYVCRKPILIHEQNAIAGTGNKFLAHLADKICVSLPDTKGFAKKTVVTGNPVRAAIRGICPTKKTGRNLLVLGGSQGAHRLNTFMVEILPELKEAGVNILHQCGEKDLAGTREAYAHNGMNPECVSAFIDDMASVYAWADLAICRSGASTVAELCACGLPAVFVPFPAAIHDHQTLNAKILADAGAALLVPENNLESLRNGRELVNLLNEPAKLHEMSKKAHSFARLDAAGAIVGQMESLINH